MRWALDAPAVEIEKSVADRKPTPKKRGSRIGFVIDPFRRRQIWYESGLEEPLIQVLIAHPAVREIREQQAVSYRDATKMKKHVFDCVVTWRSGSRSAIAIKYHDDVEKSGLRHVLACIERSVGDECADDFRIMTERHVDAVTIRNARLMISCGLDFDHAAQQRVRSCLPGMDAEPPSRGHRPENRHGVARTPCRRGPHPVALPQRTGRPASDARYPFEQQLALKG
ncbi:hypothetical protein [Jiella pelagia]|uniref:TnsA endonuclease N-terminal domain-containing protein n=1 Tax=Jiella pelagia TaxID=2986949 RepID=A0ABY7C396_9HYPH|nr:hypothetical protein [Jiella pelagia]WAP70067.1 hypothetical protein OH818_07985 [Jiella pelagia]